MTMRDLFMHQMMDAKAGGGSTASESGRRRHTGTSRGCAQIQILSEGTGEDGESDAAPATIAPRLLLVDDDPIFGKLMVRSAQQRHVHLDYCRTIEELAALSGRHFDAVIMDVDMGLVTGVELADYLETQGEGTAPVMLVSQTDHWSFARLPGSVQGFTPKRMGPGAIIDEALILAQSAGRRQGSTT